MSIRHPIKNYMTPKPISVDLSSKLEEVLATMNDHGLRHLPVKDGPHLVGVISDRDIATACGKESLLALKLTDVMSKNPYSVGVDTDASEALRVMAANRLGCVIVKGHGGDIAGIFTTTDAVRVLADCFSGQVKL